MEVLPPVDPLGAEPPVGMAPVTDDLGERLAGVEDRLDAMSERLGRLESSITGSVADEMRAATAELRRAITELGRRLVQDLPHELARHRDAIIAELRAAAGPAAVEPAVEDAPEPSSEPAPHDDLAAPETEVAERSGRAHRLRRGRG